MNLHLPEGVGMYIWNLRAELSENGGIQGVVEKFQKANLKFAFIKMVDGPSKYNEYATPANDETADTLLTALVVKLVDAGVDVYSWGYYYGILPKREAIITNQRLDQFGDYLSGHIINAEVEFKRDTKKMAEVAKTICAEIKTKNPSLPIGISTYRFPTWHMAFPFEAFMRYVDWYEPQMYWIGANNPIQQLERAIVEWRALEQRIGLAEKPIIPAGPVFKEYGWTPKDQEILDYVAACKKFGLLGTNFWVSQHAGRWGFFPLLGECAKIYHPDQPKLRPRMANIRKWRDRFKKLV